MKKFARHTSSSSVYRTARGLTDEVIREISAHKHEPEWMLSFRLNAFKTFTKKVMPTWGADLADIDFNDLCYYLQSTNGPKRSWDDVPDSIKRTFDLLGIPEAEKKYLAGVGAQYESGTVYHNIAEHLKTKEVIFMDTDSALAKYPDFFIKYFGTIVPPDDNKFAALNSAVWSGGSFIYVPKGVHVDLPLQAYFRINAERFGQFERTLIIADEGSSVHYIEGCTAPRYSSNSLHSAVVEIIVRPGARVTYTTIQNWSTNIYNLVTKRAYVYADGLMEWIDGNLGSRVTMKYPSIYLMEPGARGEILSLATAGKGQHQDVGGKVLHMASRTSSRILSKSLAKDGGRTSYRGLVYIAPEASEVKTHVVCDALMLDDTARSDTYPTMKIHNATATVEHEASVSKIGDDQLLYLMSRGMGEVDARSLMVNGFFEKIVKELPLEYAVEINRLIRLEMEGSVG